MRLGPVCPICGVDQFGEFNGRPLARCLNCHAMERTRLLWLLLERRGALHKGMRVLHFAPEPGLSRRLTSIAGSYVSADISIEQYGGFLPDTIAIDLCDFDPAALGGPFDLIVHMHVMEHLFCDVGQVLRNLAALLSETGAMYFCVPVRKGADTDESLDPTLAPEVRRKRFGQHDHVRIFGERDVVSRFTAALGPRLVALDAWAHLSEMELRMYAVNIERGITGNTIFCCSAGS